jgi:pyruvate dehydrogenase E2 component (dihydrolipoamide acetyltransferase)
MSITIRLPELSPNMEKATIIRWIKQEGDAVAAGDILVEVETDKATIEMEAMDSGTLTKILVPEGSQDIAVDTPIAVLASQTARDRPPGGGEIQEPPARIPASPFARKLARQFEVPLEEISGSGPRGRVVATDVRKAATKSPGPEEPQPTRADRSALGPQPGRAGEFTEIPIDGVRRTIAKNLSASAREVPHFRVVVDVQCDAVLSLRRAINNHSSDRRLTLNDFFLKALACAIEQTPEANVVWAQDKLVRFSTVDVAVAISAGGRLYAPILRDAARKTVTTISHEVRRLTAQAQTGVFSPRELEGGTTAVSNLGMYGVRAFDAIVNPPQSSIFAIGQAQQRPVVRDGVVAVATVATITMSCDHRAIDGAAAAKGLERLKLLIEEPVQLLA